ncbi:MAG: transcriptional regulator [Curvibacter sp.]
MSELALGTIRHLTLICEEALEDLIGQDIIEAGAKGYTVTDARGRGKRGVRDAQWLLSSNIRIEILCSDAVARRIMACVETKYAQHYGLVIFMQDALAPQADKY